MDFPTRVTIENKSHPTYTLIQIETPDRLGLLYDLVACLGRNNVYIALSRISTEKGAAIDTFYVTDAATRGKITEPRRIDELQERAAPGHRDSLAPNDARLIQPFCRNGRAVYLPRSTFI